MIPDSTLSDTVSAVPTSPAQRSADTDGHRPQKLNGDRPRFDGRTHAVSEVPDDPGLNHGFEQLLVDYTHLQRRLATMPVIEQAKGILMGRFGIDSNTAFALLQRWSSCIDVKLRHLSHILVDTAAAQTVDPATRSAEPRRPPTALDHVIADLTPQCHADPPDHTCPRGNEAPR